MRTYELMLMFSPEYTEAEVKKYIKKLEDLLIKNKASKVKADFWGKRKLAYKIKQFTEAYYVVFTFVGEPSLTHTLKELLKLEEEVFRYLLTLKEQTLQDNFKLDSSKKENSKKSVKKVSTK